MRTNYFFEKLNLFLSFSGFSIDEKSVGECVENGTVKKIQEFLTRLEIGDPVNVTENRGVDHFNHRMKEELVSGKSLEKSLQLWKNLNSEIKGILSSGLFTDVVLNGIGGSILGPLLMTIFTKGKEFYYNKSNKITLHFLNNTDPDSFSRLLSSLKFESTLLVTMSKSGGTAETMTNYFVFNDLLKEDGIKSIGEHNLCITTKGSKLDRIGQMERFKSIFYMEPFTGGRVSVGTAIGMVPAAFLGIDFSQFLLGQSKMDESTRLFKDPTKNPALLISIAIHKLTSSSGRKNMVVLGYNDSLCEYSHYLQQLYMESLGKEYSFGKSRVHEGLTVFGGVGTGEQHAFMQQIQNGCNDSFVKLVYFLKRGCDYKNESCGSMGRQLLAFFKGTENALEEKKRPFFSTVFNQSDLFNLGMMIALEERIVTFLAVLKEVNGYDQPGVELGKKSAKRMMEVSSLLEDLILEKIEKSDYNCDAKSVCLDCKELENFPSNFVDAVLSDIYANVGVMNSFSKLYSKCSTERIFKDGEFRYVFKPEVK